MRPRINLSLQVAAGILALIAPCFLAAQGAPAVSLEEQLSAQYTLVKMGSDSSGPAVVEPGTILAIQKGRNPWRSLRKHEHAPCEVSGWNPPSSGYSDQQFGHQHGVESVWLFRQMQQHKRAGRETDNDPLVSGRRKGLPLKN